MQRQFRLLALILLAYLPAAFSLAQTPAVTVLAAEFGLFGDSGSNVSTFMPSSRLPLRDGQAFGWRMKVQTAKTHLMVREEVFLPAEPKTWGDPEPGLKRRTSPDGKAAVSEYVLEPRAGYIFNSWVVTVGDPRGTWIVKVTVEGSPPRTFRFEAQ